jgi:hypothetical protein
MEPAALSRTSAAARAACVRRNIDHQTAQPDHAPQPAIIGDHRQFSAADLSTT